MKIHHIFPVLMIALSACTTCPPVPEKAASTASEEIKAKNVLCMHVKPEALSAYAECVAPADPTQTADVLCKDILPKFVALYQECRPNAANGSAQPPVKPINGSVTSYSGPVDSSLISTTTSNHDGVRTVSVTINGVTHTLSSDTEPTDLPDWPARNLTNP